MGGEQVPTSQWDWEERFNSLSPLAKFVYVTLLGAYLDGTLSPEELLALTGKILQEDPSHETPGLSLADWLRIIRLTLGLVVSRIARNSNSKKLVGPQKYYNKNKYHPIGSLTPEEYKKNPPLHAIIPYELY